MTIKSIRTGWTGISALAGNPVLGDYESIQTVVVSASTAASVEFTSIPSGYQHLQIRGISRTNRADDGDEIYLQFNTDTGSNYAHHNLEGNGTAASASAASSAVKISMPRNVAANSTANRFGVCVIDILDYRNTNKYTTVRGLGGWDSNGSGYVNLRSGLWMNTNAVESIKITAIASFVTNTHFALYGIR